MADQYSGDYNYVGVRTQEEPFELGEMEHVSSVWVDGNETDEKLNGICVTDLNTPFDSALQKQASDKENGFYYGKHQAIICGSRAERGEDLGELIIVDPVVVEIIA